MLYAVGSKIVHPCYGAGTITRIQDKTISASSHPYYVIRTVAGGLQLMVPVNNAHTVGLRQVGRAEELRRVLACCATLPQAEELNADARMRQAEMRLSLKSGDFAQVADVVRKLFYLNARRPLGTVDRQLFDQGKELLASELALALDSDLEQAMQELEQHLARMFPQEGSGL
jgi:CarD family transcriptional regulator